MRSPLRMGRNILVCVAGTRKFLDELAQADMAGIRQQIEPSSARRRRRERVRLDDDTPGRRRAIADAEAAAESLGV
ncbi:MAG: hypothetical protein AAGJ38_07560 [Planctomycetota bacterium]